MGVRSEGLSSEFIRTTITFAFPSEKEFSLGSSFSYLTTSMKKSRLFFYSSFSVLLILLTITLDSCKIGRFVYYNFADITDHKIFPSRPLTAAGKPFYFIPADSVLHPKGITAQGKSYTFGEFLEKNATVAFLIIRGDTLLYESYFNQYTDSSVVASFSMAKSVTSILIGMAIEDGLIRSVEDPVSLYLPELAHYGFDRVTLHDVLQMTSGLDFNESYVNPMGDAATFYYGTNLHKAVNNLRLKQEPGKHLVTRLSWESRGTSRPSWYTYHSFQAKKAV